MFLIKYNRYYFNVSKKYKHLLKYNINNVCKYWQYCNTSAISLFLI
jgi:hypothetical protein